MDAQGNIKSVTFNLSKDKAIADPEKTVAEGYLLNAGSAINARGIPYYMTQLNEFVRNFSEMFNQIESKGQNLNGIHHLHFCKQSQTQPRYMISRNQRLTASCLMDRLPQ